MTAVQRHIDACRMDLATGHILSDDIAYKTLDEIPDMEKEEAQDDTKTFALVLNVKVPKISAKKLGYQRGGKEVDTYHRLVLCRELQEGGVFYILSIDATESCHLFRDPNIQYVGGFVAVFEGVREKMIHGIPVVVTKTSLVSIVPRFENIKINPVLSDLDQNETIKGFMIEVIAPRFVHVGRVPSCRSRFCDSRHTARCFCPALTSGRTSGHAITFMLSSSQHGILNAEYNGEALMEVFASPRVLANPKSPMDGLRRAVREVSEHYFANQVPFIVAGWQKRRRGHGDEAALVKKIHITFVAPKKVLADAPRFDPAAVVRPRPLALGINNERVVQDGYMAPLNQEVEEVADEFQDEV